MRQIGSPFPPFAVLIPVGPGPAELERARDVMESVLAHEPRTRWIVLIDDGGGDRELDRLVAAPERCTLVSLRNVSHARWSGKHGGLCAADLLGLAWVHAWTDARFALRLDTDALAIAPFAERIDERLRSGSGVGMVGSFDRTCNGEARDFTPHAACIARLAEPFVPLGRRRTIREHLRLAVASGYRAGEHCLGGACAIARDMIDGMATLGVFDDPRLWVASGCPDDVMLGIYARAVGLRSANATADGEPFGLKYVGLPDAPDRLLARGYGLVHSVRNDARFPEDAIRAFYRAHRPTALH